jgi:hypothetical protein
MSPKKKHLLIFDNHNFHVTINIVKITKRMGSDLIILPSWTFHTLQSLDVSCSKLFKTVFWAYQDV